jgi:phosphonate transport system permease protein
MTTPTLIRVHSRCLATSLLCILRSRALAGLLAVGFHSIGFVGKLLAEALEEAPRGPIKALRATGAPAASPFSKGYWPWALRDRKEYKREIQ